MLTIQSAHAPRWDNAEKTSLTLLVTFKEHADNIGEVPFTACADDTSEHGAALYAGAVAGKFGDIRDFVPPVVTGAIRHELWKVQRDQAVSSMVVTTFSGLAFDGDEQSQGRMSRTIVSLMHQPKGTAVRWVMADNSIAMVDIDDLKEALAAAIKRQTELWVKP